MRVVLEPFHSPSLRGRGLVRWKVVGLHKWGPALGWGQVLGLTHDVTGREWIPEGQPTLGGFLIMGGGQVGQLRGDIMELLPDGLVFLGDGCERLGYPTQLM